VIERGADRSAVLTAKANLARQRGALDEALRLHEEASALDRARLGEDHPLTAVHRHNTAGVLRRLARFDEAKTAYLQALRVERRWLGEGSIEAGLTQNSLGLLALESGALDEAERWLLAARTALRGRSEEPLATLNLALLAIARRQHEPAIALATEALARDTATFGAGHLRAARAAKVRAVALIGARRWTEARRDLTAARAALEGATDAESQMVRDECETLERGMAHAAPRARPRQPSEPRPASAGVREGPAAVVTEPRRAGPAPSGSGSYGPAQRWGP
jgi:tetratricopeptide (TPR) repeat protein